MNFEKCSVSKILRNFEELMASVIFLVNAVRELQANKIAHLRDWR